MQGVIEKILDEAKKEAEAIARRYESEIIKIKQDYKARIDNAEKRLNAEIEKRKQEQIMQAIAQVRLEFNKRITTEMQMHINNVLQSAVQKLSGQKKYLDFLKGLIKSSGVKDGELYLSRADLQKYQSQIEKFMKQEGYNFVLKDDDQMSGGVVIKKEKITFLGSIDVIIETMQEELKIALARTLGFV